MNEKVYSEPFSNGVNLFVTFSFFSYYDADNRTLHLAIRRRRQLCIRDGPNIHPNTAGAWFALRAHLLAL